MDDVFNPPPTPTMNDQGKIPIAKMRKTSVTYESTNLVLTIDAAAVSKAEILKAIHFLAELT